MNALGKSLYSKALAETSGDGEEAMVERLIELVAEACAARAFKVAPSDESACEVSNAIEKLFDI